MAREYDDTEYQFNEGEEGEVIEGQEKAPLYEDIAKKPSKGSVKNIIILIIMAIIAVLIVYKVFSLMFGGKEEPKIIGVVAPAIVQPTEIKPEEVAKEIGEIKDEVAPEVTLSEPEVMQVSEEKEVKKDEITEEFKSSINKQIAEVQEGNKKLIKELKRHKSVASTRLISLEQTVDSLKSGVNDLQKTLMDLSSQLNRVESATKLRRIQQIRAEKARKKAVQAKKRYFVEAVIPGRAWIRGMDGSAFTISIGDQIIGYGKVVTINSYSGTVTTSSGDKIYYGIN